MALLLFIRDIRRSSRSPLLGIELGPVVDGLYDYSIVSDDKALSLCYKKCGKFL